MHNTFDKFKLSYHKEYEIINENEFTGVTRFNVTYKRTFTSIGLEITIDKKNHVTNICFNSKLRQEKAYELISHNNINLFYDLISQHIKIPYNDFTEGYCKYVEITKDIDVGPPAPVLIESLYLLAKLQIIYRASDKCRKQNGLPTSFELIKKNLTNRYKDFLSIYIKENELLNQNQNNLKFFKLLSIEGQEELKKYYKNKVRIEAKLPTKKIKQFFNIETIPTLNNILNSPINALKNVVKTIYDPVLNTTLTPSEINNTKDWEMTRLVSSFSSLEDMKNNMEGYIYKVGDSTKERKTKKVGIDRYLKKGREIIMSNNCQLYNNRLKIYKMVVEQL